MKIRIFENPLVNSLSNLCIATFPFITLGTVGHNRSILYISFSIVLISILAFLIVIILGIKREVHYPVISKIIDDILAAPYAFTISNVIVLQSGIITYTGFWVALLCVAMILISNLIKEPRK